MFPIALNLDWDYIFRLRRDENLSVVPDESYYITMLRRPPICEVLTRE